MLFYKEWIVNKLVNKILNLRIFDDENGVMNKSILDVGGEILSVSQFTLYANCKKGNRPDFLNAAKPDYASEIYEYIIEKCKNDNIEVQTGSFGAEGTTWTQRAKMQRKYKNISRIS